MAAVHILRIKNGSRMYAKTDYDWVDGSIAAGSIFSRKGTEKYVYSDWIQEAEAKEKR